MLTLIMTSLKVRYWQTNRRRNTPIYINSWCIFYVYELGGFQNRETIRSADIHAHIY